MDESAPITWLVNEINAIVTAGASATAATIANTITPIVSICFSIYILLIMLNYMRGAEQEPVLDFWLRCVGFAIVIGLGVNTANYTNVVIPMVTGIGNDLASAISNGSASAGTLDQLALHYLKIISDGYKDLDGLPDLLVIGKMIFLSIKVAIILLGLIPFLVAATLAIIIANVGSILIAMVGPLFFAFLLFPATRQYFSSWVNTAISYALIPIFVAVIATISVSLSAKMLSSSGSLNEASFKMVFLAAIGNLILLFLIKQVSALASSLSAGGINAGMVGGVGSAASTIRSGIRGSARDAKGIASTYQGGKQLLSRRRNSIRKAG